MYNKEIVAGINTFIDQKLVDRRFKSAKYCGIATVVKREDQSMPILVDEKLEEFAAFDDNHGMVCYHRIDSFSYNKTKLQFGDYEANEKETANSYLVVYGDRAILELTQEDLIMALVSSFPDTFQQKLITDLGLGSITINVKSINNNPQSAWATEFKGVDYSLPPEKILFVVNYTVEIQYDKSCIEICKNC